MRRRRGKKFKLIKSLGGFLALALSILEFWRSSSVCRCPLCGYTTQHLKSKPCSSIKCPGCEASLRLSFVSKTG